jgi:hypothetical protein
MDKCPGNEIIPILRKTLELLLSTKIIGMKFGNRLVPKVKTYTFDIKLIYPS